MSDDTVIETITLPVPIRRSTDLEKAPHQAWGKFFFHESNPRDSLIVGIRAKGTKGPSSIELLINETRHFIGALPFKADVSSLEAGTRPIPVHGSDLVEIRSAEGFIELDLISSTDQSVHTITRRVL